MSCNLGKQIQQQPHKYQRLASGARWSAAKCAWCNICLARALLWAITLHGACHWALRRRRGGQFAVVWPVRCVAILCAGNMSTWQRAREGERERGMRVEGNSQGHLKSTAGTNTHLFRGDHTVGARLGVHRRARTHGWRKILCLHKSSKSTKGRRRKTSNSAAVRVSLK